MYNINRRKFLGLFGCGCCSILLPSCTSVPITDRKQLSIIPEATINRQAAAAYESFRTKTKCIVYEAWFRYKKVTIGRERAVVGDEPEFHAGRKDKYRE